MALIKKPAGSGTTWEDLPAMTSRPKRGIMVNLDGVEGGGKSSLALTLARLGPVGVVDPDQGLDRAFRPTMPKGRKMKVQSIPIKYVAGLGSESSKNSCMPAWKAAKSMSLEAAEKWATGGIIIDTASEIWEVLRLGAFGTLTPKGRTDSLYGPVNAEFRQWLRNIQRTHMRNLILINQVKDEWIKNKKSGESMKSGKKERVGFKELGYLADMTLRCYREGGEFKARVEICKLAPNGPAMEGQIIEGDDLDLVKIFAMMTGTEEEEWLK